MDKHDMSLSEDDSSSSSKDESKKETRQKKRKRGKLIGSQKQKKDDTYTRRPVAKSLPMIKILMAVLCCSQACFGLLDESVVESVVRAISGGRWHNL